MHEQKYQNPAEKLAFTLLNNKYRIGGSFKEGGYGHVYYAEDLNGKPFAIKVVHLVLQNKPQEKKEKILRSLMQEDRMMMICQSQFTIKCYEAFQNEEMKLKFIVMELCEFGSLEDLIYLKGHLTQQEAKIILKHNLCGLAEIHRHGLKHRDIKSSNICFNKKHAVICDFGCSKQFLSSEQKPSWRAASFRKNGTITGTIISQSPEMLAGHDYGFKNDIWAIGILHYEMLTGVHPFIFDSHFTCEKAVQFIKQNLPHIYEPQYIKKNLQNQEIYGRGNCIISEESQNFLKKILVFDQKQRLLWKDLQKQQYLLNDQKKSEGKKGCFLPLKDVNWEQYTKGFQNIDTSQQKIKSNQKSLDKKCIRIVEKMQKLDRKTSQNLRRRAEDLYKRQKTVYQEMRTIDFQVKRINLLMSFRGYLEHLQKIDMKIKCDKVGLMVVRYCFVKLKELQKILVEKDLVFIKEKLQLDSLIQLINCTYSTDQRSFNIDHDESPTHKIKSLFYNTSKTDFYNEIKNESIDTVYKNIEKETKDKLYTRIKAFLPHEKIEHIQFFQQPLLILRAKYEPNQNDHIWRQWNSFGSIIQYIAQLEKNQK